MITGHVNLSHFKEYCSFLYQNHLEELAKEDLKRNKEIELPLLKYFMHLSEEELFALSKKGMEEYLINIIEDKAIAAIFKSNEDWKEDRLPGISREKVEAADIVLIYNARKHTLVNFLPKYTQSTELFVKIVNELEDFYTFQGKLALQTFAEIKQDQIRNNENRLKEAQRLALLGNWEYNLSNGKVYWSEQLYKIYGLNKEDFPNGITGTQVEAFLQKEQVDAFREKIKNAVDKSEKYSHELTITKLNGEKRILCEEGYIEKNNKGETIVKGISQDITERKEIEAKLVQRERFIAHVAESSPDIIYVYDFTTRQYLYLNKELTHRLGYDKEEIKMDAFSLIHPDDLFLVRERFKKFENVSDNEIIEDEIRVLDDQENWRWINTRGMVFKRNEKGDVIQIIGTARDVTSEKNLYLKSQELNTELNRKNEELTVLQEELQASNEELIDNNLKLDERVKSRTAELERQKEYLISVLESMPPMTWTALPNGRVNYYSKRWRDFTGQTEEQSLGNGWEQAVNPEDLKVSWEAWSHSIKTGLPYEIEARVKRISDNQYRWVLARAFPLYNSYGEITLWVGSCTDIDDIKNFTNVLLEKEKVLEKHNKDLIRINSDLDNFIYTASHDLKAPVSNIEGLINTLFDMLKEKNKNDQDLEMIITMINTSVLKFQSTIKDLTEISKIQKRVNEQTEELIVEEIFEEVKNSIRTQIKEADAKIKTDFQCPVIHFSRINFTSILHNLLTNAIKYRSPDRKPVIEVICKKTENYILFEIKDNGLGILKKHQDNIFGMFKRFHDHVEGSGVGLYLVKRIVDNAEGKIEVESIPEQGSIFKIYLPSGDK